MATNTTHVPDVTFGPTGFVAPSESLILAGVQQDINDAFGGNLNPGLSTPQGQLASSETAIIGDKNATFVFFTNQVDPAYSSGRMQDAIARIYFIDRIPGAPTVQPCNCLGLANTIIPVGALAKDQSGNLWACQNGGIIPNSGVITLNFAFSQNGPVSGPLTLSIYQAIFGWDTITPSGNAALGVNVETRSEFELRRGLSTAINSTGHLPGILGAVLAVPGVLDAFVTENDSNLPVVSGGVTLNPNSVYICVLGGNSLSIAQAIWSRKAPGCSYTGNTTITVVDPSPSYISPPPSYLVSYQTPTIVTFAVLVTIRNNQNIPADALTLIQNTIISAFAGTDGGSRAKIGSIVFAPRYYGGVLALGNWAELIQIQIGVSSAAASIVGSITGTTLTVTSVVSGVLKPEQLLQGTGLLTGTALLVVSQLNGSIGGTGAYVVSFTQNIPSQNLTATTLVDDIQMNINQAPTVLAGTIYLVLM